MPRLLPLVLLVLCLAAPARAGSCLREDFDSLAGWSEYAPVRANRLTGYGPAQVDGRAVLEARSRNSVSGLVSRAGFDPALCPRLRWAWRVENPLPAADLAADFRAAFGKAPPAHARLAVMNDSDDTHGSALAYVDFIEAGP